ncbi:MAG TPA: protein kinase [Thermoanaerobaculia bacterium]
MADSNRAVDRVRTVALLSEGVQGQVFVGVDDLLRRRLVVKRMPSGASPRADQRTRMIHEARVLSRLDHANVLRVYDYSERDEYDVFTFEYLEGTPLVDAIAAGLEFAKKVRVATDVASVLSVAHRNEIVHGALSPRSVAISKAGAIKIVDFHSISTNVDGSRGDPRWSSPEEQRGAEPTRESDMYRFGLLLREMFGTRDRDVRSLLAALLCEAPSDRLTAAAALERLQRFGSRRARRLRVAAVALLATILSLGATKITLDLKREHAAAVAALADAESRRAAANELVAFMVEDLRPKLLPVGKLEIMDATSNKAFDYFASIAPEQISAAEIAVNVQALTQFAEAQFHKDDMRAAEDAARKAISLADAGLRRHPNDVEILFARAAAHAEMRNVLVFRGDRVQAFVHARIWLATCTDLLRRKPGDVRFLTSQAYALFNLARLYDHTGDVDTALRHYDRAVTSLRSVLRRRPNDDSYVKLFIVDRFAAMALLRWGRFYEGRRRLERARAELEAFRRRVPSNREVLDTMASCDKDLASAALATGDLEAARRYAIAQLTVGKQLMAFDSARYWWTCLVSIAHRSLGTIARMNGDDGEALRQHTAAIEVLSVVRESEGILVPLETATNRVELARSLLAAGRPKQALLQASLAVETCRPMPQEMFVQNALAEALLVRGEALAARGEPEEASNAWEEALRTAESIRSRLPGVPETNTRARALLRLGRLDRATPLIERLAALGYRNREFEALCEEKGAFINSQGRGVTDGREERRQGQKAPSAGEGGPG